MTARARLLSVRLQGFKSFADRTVVEFGPGVSAIVGPNGSGKSNLADALRWTLGEQGRALRARKSEDVVWAGSERRAATGMADVTLLLDNGDGLLPVGFEVVELGRRLYRSGENEYILNRTKVRLRDLVEMLDAGHLADNAFLFIGQGMVDQALALRPEERRPLFEEVAGVRRHERRRRRAEEQLAEAEANLARVRDVLAELRPQARRLAVQAERQETRRSVGDELADALLAAAHHRWYGASSRAAAAAARATRARMATDAAAADVADTEARVGIAAAELGGRSEDEATQATSLDVATREVTELRLEEGRIAADLAARDREVSALRSERAAIAAEIEAAGTAASEAVPPPDAGLDAEIASAERALADVAAEIATLTAGRDEREASVESMRRAAAAREVELDSLRRSAAEIAGRAADERGTADGATTRLAEVVAALEASRRVLAEAAETEERLTRDRADSRTRREAAESAHAAAVARSVEVEARLAATRARIAEATEDIEHRSSDELRRLGSGRLVGDGLDVEPGWRPAVDAALADALGAPVVPRRALGDGSGLGGSAVIEDERTVPADREADRTFRDRLASVEGGMLTDTVRSDPSGLGRRLLARAGWVPDGAVALELQDEIPAGWTIVTRDGSVVVRGLIVTFDPERGRLDRRAAVDRARAAIDELAADREIAGRATDEAAAAVDVARSEEAGIAAALANAIAAHRSAIEAERAAGRETETLTREAAWHAASTARLEDESRRATESLSRLEAVVSAATTGAPGADGSDGHGVDPAAVATWEQRAAEIRRRLDALVARRRDVDGEHRAVEQRRATANARLGAARERLGRLTDVLAERDGEIVSLGLERERIAGRMAQVLAAEVTARAAHERARAGSADIRARLADAERAAAAARATLHEREAASRADELEEVEARISLDAVREAVLVDLAALGEVGLTRLRGDGDAAPDAAAFEAALDSDGSVDDAAAFEAAIAAVAPRWASEAPTGEPPSAGRLATLRRSFHELGATNPFAAEEYAEVRDRLATMEEQEQDLGGAIESTRRLIAELNALIADQFRATFTALESAFDRRFKQLFGGGYARLELTDPTDLAATGVEIVARPPAKKQQALAMLSGGERALTAVALLFAMLEVRPVPFCVLDEVDAALDEANIGRFTDALTELAVETQFIVITHNRGTIEVADALYGVTVGEDSVSRVISLRLDEATAMAEQGRTVDQTDPAPVGA